MIFGPLGSKGDHPLLERFHDARERPCLVVVTAKPAQYGFGQDLDIGAEVTIEGLVEAPLPHAFGVKVKGMLGFYDWTCFRPVDLDPS